VDAPKRIGAETRPFEYPHLYQIQAGDWRISYAVERNRLAILVLEVLNPDGSGTPDPVRESRSSKMKIKLLDRPEDSPSRDLRPDEIGRRVKIRLLDMAEESGPVSAEMLRRTRLRLDRPKAQRPRPVVRLDGTTGIPLPSTLSAALGEAMDPEQRKAMPLDSPTM
jgi:hypothetical protein